MLKDFSIEQLRFKTINEERVWVNDVGQEGLFKYDSGDTTSADNTGTIIVDQVGGKRWKRDFKGGMNVKWFGAKGDGATDDTVAIQAAINALSSYSQPSVTGSYYGISDHLYIPYGRYVISSSLTASNSYIRIKGEGIFIPHASFDLNDFAFELLM